MYEPKYKLNQKDAARWHELVTRECVNCGLPDKPGGKVRPPNPKFPPLTKAEKLELERLQRKQRKKIHSHPAVKASIACQRRHDRKIRRLLHKLKALEQKLKLNEAKSKS